MRSYIFHLSALFLFCSINQTLGQQIDNPSKIAPNLLQENSIRKDLSFRLLLNNYAEFVQWKTKNAAQLEIEDYREDFSTVLASNINQSLFEKLLLCPFIDFIDKGNRPVLEETEINKEGFRINKIGVLHSQMPTLNGFGMNVSVKERAFDKTDIDFRGRVMELSDFPAQFTAHATEMATLIAGGGNSSPYGKGVAWRSNLYTSSFTNLMPDLIAGLTGKGIYVQNHSYGVGIENYYGIETQAYDKQCNENPTLLHIFSSGNSGNQGSTTGTYAGLLGFANLTAQFKMSKNTMSIGEIDANDKITALSSRGPAYDGRIKPEITAYGGAGSSESAALVSGISLLVQQAYKNKYNVIPPAYLAKAAIINSADDLGRPEVDFEYGFGKADALGAVSSIIENRFFNDLVGNGQQKTYSIQIPNGTRKLKITLVWHDTEASINAVKALNNDLDLELLQISSGTSWKPWVLSNFPSLDSLKKNAVRKADHLNNIEQVTLESPLAGEYQLIVKGYSLTSATQNFSLVYEFESGVVWTYPSKNDYLQGGKSILLNWDFNQNSVAGTLEYSLLDDDNWTTIANLPDLKIGSFQWVLPDTLSQVRFRIKGTGIESYSDTVLISKAIIPKVGYNCDDKLMLFWEKIEGVDSYIVYKIGVQYLEPIATTTDTLYIVDKNQEKDVYFAVSSVFKNQISSGLTIDYTFQGVACYYKSFKVREVISDTILFDFALGTNYQLKSLDLERWEGGAFKSILKQLDIDKTNWIFSDNQPLIANNTYRIAMTDVRGNVYYSNEVEAFNVKEDEFLLYPNPAKQDGSITLVDVGNRIQTIRVFDSFGRLLKKYEPRAGEFKDLPIIGLNSGIYYLALYSDSGKVAVKKLLVE